MIKSKLYGKFNQEKVFESCMVTGYGPNKLK